MNKIRFKSLELLLILVVFSCENQDFNPTPAIVSVQPNAASPNESVLILGGNFSPTPSENNFDFGGVSAAVTEATNNSAKVIVPVGAKDGFITVTVNGVSASSISEFDVLDEVAITGVFPTEAKPLDTITLFGVYFETEKEKNMLRFNNIEVEVLEATTKEMSVVVPANAQIGAQEVVLNARGQTANFSEFKVSEIPPFYFSSLANSPVTSILNKVSMVDSKTAYVVGEAGKILKTTDGGESWIELSSGTLVTLRDVHAFDANTVVICGSSGVYMKTTDGGETWNTIDIGTTERLRRLYFVNSTTGWMVGSGGVIYKTTNGGNDWIEQISTTTISLYGVHFLDKNNGWVVGNDDILLKTSDGGSTWNQVDIVTGEDLTSIVFKDSQTGWITADDNVLLATTDGGASWVNQNIVLADIGDDLNDITIIGNTILAVADDHQMIRSEDLGLSWTVLDRRNDISPIIGHIEGVDAYQNTAIAVGVFGVIIK